VKKLNPSVNAMQQYRNPVEGTKEDISDNATIYLLNFAGIRFSEATHRLWKQMNKHQEKKLRPERPDAPDGRDVLDATSLTRTQLTTAWGVRTQLPRWSAFGRSAPGHRASGGSCYGIYIPDEEFQGINLLDAARVFRTQGVKVIFFRTESVKANVWTTLTMAHDT